MYHPKLFSLFLMFFCSARLFAEPVFQLQGESTEQAYVLQDHADAARTYLLPKKMQGAEVGHIYRENGEHVLELGLSPSVLPKGDTLKSFCKLGRVYLSSLPKQLFTRLETLALPLQGIDDSTLVGGMTLKIFTRYPRLLVDSVLLNGIKGGLAIECRAVVEKGSSEVTDLVHGIEVNANYKKIVWR